jgi:hypothetical protein
LTVSVVVHALEEMRAVSRAKVIEKIERVLAEARAGEICAIAIATVAPDLATGSCFSLGDKTLTELLRSVCLMQHRMIESDRGPLD